MQTLCIFACQQGLPAPQDHASASAVLAPQCAAASGPISCIDSQLDNQQCQLDTRCHATASLLLKLTMSWLHAVLNPGDLQDLSPDGARWRFAARYWVDMYAFLSAINECCIDVCLIIA